MTLGSRIQRDLGHMTWSWSDETHLPTLEPGSQTPPRFPRAHGHQGRPQNPERASRSGPEIAQRVSNTLTGTVLEPPEASVAGDIAMSAGPPAVSVCMDVIKKRADFLKAASTGRQGTKGMMVQARRRPDDGPWRVGFTCSKKVGNAVARNRAKRRLREVARTVLAEHGRAGWDYVLIGRANATAQRPFDDLQSDLIYALRKLHK